MIIGVRERCGTLANLPSTGRHADDPREVPPAHALRVDARLGELCDGHGLPPVNAAKLS